MFYNFNVFLWLQNIKRYWLFNPGKSSSGFQILCKVRPSCNEFHNQKAFQDYKSIRFNSIFKHEIIMVKLFWFRSYCNKIKFCEFCTFWGLLFLILLTQWELSKKITELLVTPYLPSSQGYLLQFRISLKYLSDAITVVLWKSVLSVFRTLGLTVSANQ